MSEEKKRGTLSRREFMKDAGFIGAATAIGSTMSLAAVSATPTVAEAATGGPVTLEVHDPSGGIEISAVFAKRLDTLDGKTIAQVGNSWEGHRSHPLIKQLLEKMYLRVKIVPHTGMPDYTDLDLLTKAVQEKKVDAVIFGNAG
jgi:hypothetical protein